MTLGEAITTLDETDFSGQEPEVLLALSVVINNARTRARGLEFQDLNNRVVETSTD